jgi:hypothetical protein
MSEVHYKLIRVMGSTSLEGDYRFHQIEYFPCVSTWGIVGTVRLNREDAILFFGQEQADNALIMEKNYYHNVWYINPQ